jgi:hypothetical protein
MKATSYNLRERLAKSTRIVNRICCLQTANFPLHSCRVLWWKIVHDVHEHPVLLYPIRQSLPMSRTVIILKFKTMKKSRGFASFAERAAVHGFARALCWHTDWHLSCSQNINTRDTIGLTETQQLEPYGTKYMTLGLLWIIFGPALSEGLWNLPSWNTKTRLWST